MVENKIADFYKNKEIFITGGTGFMGRVLIEKLSRSCSKLKNLYILIRPKKGKTIYERLNELFDLPVFNNIRKNNPELLKKIIPINGDVAEINLGINEEDFKRMSNVSIIFHSAATVRFNGPLKDTIFLNTRGTFEIVNFAKTLKNLIVLAYVSTAFSNPDQSIIEEKIYSPYSNWRDAIKIAENFDNDLLDLLDLKYRDFKTPNVYTFTKNLAENIINDYKNELPCVIYRPTIVISAVEEPLPGWVDNYNNVIGLTAASATGILKVHRVKNVILPVIPVDISIRGLIVAAYQKGQMSKEKIGIVDVVNCSIGSCRSITCDTLVTWGYKYLENNPFEKTIMKPCVYLTKCKFLLITRLIIYQLLVAIIGDTLLKYFGQKPILMKLQRILIDSDMNFKYFYSNKWIFKTENFKKYEEMISKDEYDTFSYLSKYQNLTNFQFFTTSMNGIREYLLKEDKICSSKGKKRYKMLQYIYYTLNIFYYLFLAYFLNILLKIFRLPNF